MNDHYIFSSLTRISNLSETPFEVKVLPREEWANGDYVVGEINKQPGLLNRVELTNGRMAEVGKGDHVVGAFGVRFATVEATGTWEAIEDDAQMNILTAAGLMGKMTSKSIYIPDLMETKYIGHVHVDGKKIRMSDFVRDIPDATFNMPTILIVGTSMSAGKTTAAKIIIRQLKKAGHKVLGAKLTGAGRYRDILSMRDAGADHIADFVDVGLPSSIYPKEEYLTALRKLLSHMAGLEVNIAVIEIGASPLEPYNGDVAIDEIKDCIKCTILCASDPYAVYGVMKAFNVKPSIVSGTATNTLGGINLVEKLCGVKALNIIDTETLPELRQIIDAKLDLKYILPNKNHPTH